MNDLIRRKDAIDALGEEPLVWDEWTDEYNKGMRTLWAVAKRDIESLPSIDAVPVVRCKDCKHSYTMMTARAKDGAERWTRFCNKHKDWYPKNNWFCADGEREES